MSPRRKRLWYLYPYYLLLSLVAATGLLILTDTPLDSTNLAWAVVIGVCASALGFAFLWKLNRTLEKTRDGARRFAEGDLGFRLEVPESEELGELAETLNQMAAQLDERISTISRQRTEQEAILASMIEGVIAVDNEACIMQINTAAAQLIGATPGALIDRSLYEVIRNRELHQLLDRALGEGKPVEGEIIFHGTSEKSIQVHCTALRNTAGSGIGALVVLNDITRIRRLERMRRDFVANVSHELKTPLTSIRGFAETLLDGALENQDEARRFCIIIAKQVDRLQAIIEDLLSLSRIEQEVERGQITLRPSSLGDVLQAAADIVTHQAAEKGITISIDCDPAHIALINPPLFEQVAVNLIDNAVKYSESGKNIVVRVVKEADATEIKFIDRGYGIDPANLDRIFERFYRVDKARSRKAGGTGLGLAIVKHIVSAHNGRIRVESTPGSGSTFTIQLPLPPAKSDGQGPAVGA